MGDQHQRNVLNVFQQQVLLACATAAFDSWVRDRGGQALHVPQNTLHHLFKIALALAQVDIIHFVKLPSHDIELRGERPFSVVEPVCDPMLHAIGHGFVLQQHEVHIQQRGQLWWCILGHALQQSVDLFHHSVAGRGHAGNFTLDLIGFDEIVGHIHAAGRHQHGASNSNTACHGESVDGKCHVTRLRQICR
jgi:hypothetical protein